MPSRHLGVGALIAAISGLIILRYSFCTSRQALSFVSRYRTLARPFLVEYSVAGGSAQAVTLGTANLAGLAASGALRAGQALIGPTNILYSALRVVFLPELSRLDGSRSKRGRRLAMQVCLIATAGTAIICAAVVLIPTSWGLALFGQSWALVQLVLLPLCAQKVVSVAGMGPQLALRASWHAKESAQVRAIAAISSLGFGLGGAAVFGLPGAAYGLALSALVMTGGYYVAYSRVIRLGAPHSPRKPEQESRREAASDDTVASSAA